MALSESLKQGVVNIAGSVVNMVGIHTRGLTDFSVGFSKGAIGMPHYNISLTRTIVKLKGQSRDMPWNSSKSGIDTKHPVFQALQNMIIEATKKYSQVCRSLQGKWDTALFPHTKGKIKKENLDTFENVPKNFLPTPPPSKPR